MNINKKIYEIIEKLKYEKIIYILIIYRDNLIKKTL